MNKFIAIAATTLALSACTELGLPQTQATEAAKTEVVADVKATADAAKTEVVADAKAVADTAGAQCLQSDTLTNETFKVIPKGTAGTIVTEKGKQYFVVNGAKNDFTGVPFKLGAC